MAVTISVQNPSKKMNDHYHVYLQDNGLYWFLTDFFKKVHEATGQQIQLFGSCNFTGSTIQKFRDLIIHELDELDQDNTGEWNVYLGKQSSPVQRDIYQKVTKKEILAILYKLFDITNYALQWDKVIYAAGD